MKSQDALFKPTKVSGLPSTRFLERDLQTGTADSNVIFVTFSSGKSVVNVPGAVDIDDLVAELESLSTENAEELKRGRQWVADTFYSEHQSLAQMRLKKGWSQAELARQTNTSQPYIARLESGKVDPQMSTARKIANALGVSIEAFSQALSHEDAS